MANPVKTGNQYVVELVDRTVSHNSYGVGVAYKLFQSASSTSYEHALRLPESNELLGNESQNINAAYQLRPEKSHNINLGLILGTLIAKHSMADINFFVRNIHDRFSVEASTDGYYGYENLGKVLSKGFDAEYNYEFDNKLFLSCSVSFLMRFNLVMIRMVRVCLFGDRLRNAYFS